MWSLSLLLKLAMVPAMVVVVVASELEGVVARQLQAAPPATTEICPDFDVCTASYNHALRSNVLSRL